MISHKTKRQKHFVTFVASLCETLQTEMRIRLIFTSIRDDRKSHASHGGTFGSQEGFKTSDLHMLLAIITGGFNVVALNWTLAL